MKKYARHEPLVKDHTAMIAAKTCLRKFFYQIVIGKVPNETAIYLTWGSSYHKFREVLELTKDVAEAMKAGLEIWDKGQGADPPVGTKWEFLTKARLLASFKAGYEWWCTEKKQGKIEVIAVEQPFNIQLPDGSYNGGRADQIIKLNGVCYGRDFKTTSKEGSFYSRGLEPNDQFTRYTYSEGKLTGMRVQGQLVEVLYNSKKDGPKISTYITTRSEYQLKQWEKEAIFMNKILDMCREEDTWPMEEAACAFCPYHSVCKAPSEGAMMAKLDSEYVTRPWDHTTV